MREQERAREHKENEHFSLQLPFKITCIFLEGFCDVFEIFLDSFGEALGSFLGSFGTFVLKVFKRFF